MYADVIFLVAFLTRGIMYVIPVLQLTYTLQ